VVVEVIGDDGPVAISYDPHFGAPPRARQHGPPDEVAPVCKLSVLGCFVRLQSAPPPGASRAAIGEPKSCPKTCARLGKSNPGQPTLSRASLALQSQARRQMCVYGTEGQGFESLLAR
jgi:hypothetical protein